MTNSEIIKSEENFFRGVLVFFPWNEDWNSFMYPDENSIIKDIEMLKKADLQIVRMDFLWHKIEPEKGAFDFLFYDRLVDILISKDVKILGILGYSALWANKQKKWNLPPENENDYASFVEKTIKRYRDKIKYWEFWNEPNINVYFEVPSWEKEYVRILKPAYAAAKKADPSCVILNGGLGQGVVESLEALYQSGAKDYFDCVNVHPFLNPVELSRRPFSKVIELEMDQVAGVMKKYKDEKKKIWITEIGCPGRDRNTPCWNIKNRQDWFMGKTPDETRQSEFIYDIFTGFDKHPFVEAVFWAFLRDTKHFKDDTDYFGLLTWDGKPKKAYEAMRKSNR